MDSFNIMFFILAALILFSSIACVVTKSILRAATYLFFALLGTAGLYFLMGYTFLGAVQLMVYAGGVVVLYVFAILLTRGRKDQLSKNSKSKIFSTLLLCLVGLAIFVLGIMKYQFQAEALSAPNEGVLKLSEVGSKMLSTGDGGYLLPFEAVSVLLLACIVAALVIARKR
ncbi:MAG: NADH-quinone oxidoreductase subunit J [Alloprevotella sp.]|nr:NADH-quinone oxidoreductase subunit J [Alloprevotella sp.]